MSSVAGQIQEHVQQAVTHMTSASNHLSAAARLLADDLPELAQKPAGKLLRTRIDDLRIEMARSAFLLGQSCLGVLRHAAMKRLGTPFH